MLDLSLYVQRCVQHELYSEASYVMDIIRRVRAAPFLSHIHRRLKQANEELAATEVELQAQCE
jgi:hypothetical protein